MNSIGFIVLTHNNEKQAIELARILNKLYDDPPIVFHHDFSKCNFSISAFPKNVAFVKDFEITGWGTFSLVSAKMKALQLLYNISSPEFYIVLSGADFPIMSADSVYRDLCSMNASAFIRSTKIEFNNLDKKWKKQYYDRYCSLKCLFKRRNKNNVEVISQITISRDPRVSRFISPFNSDYPCWGGEFWYTGTKLSAEYLIQLFQKDNKVINHYKNTKIPDESIFQTLLNNSNEVKCVNKNFRYVDWSEGKAHPKNLVYNDFDRIVKSQSHFARKFDENKSKDLKTLILENLC